MLDKMTYHFCMWIKEGLKNLCLFNKAWFPNWVVAETAWGATRDLKVTPHTGQALKQLKVVDQVSKEMDYLWQRFYSLRSADPAWKLDADGN